MIADAPVAAPRRPTIDAADPLYSAFASGLNQKRIVVPYCEVCAREVWPPRELCPYCLGPLDASRELPPTGTIYSFVICHRGFHPWFKEIGDYVIVIVELKPGVRMYGNLIGDSELPRIGRPVGAVFTPASEGSTLLEWSIVDA